MLLGLILLIIFALAALGIYVFSIVKSVQLIKNPQETVDFRTYLKHEAMLLLGFVVSFVGMLIFIYRFAEITPKWYEGLQAILGGAIFAASLFSATNLFMVHYYRKNVPEKLNKWLFRVMMIAFVLFVLSFFVCTNGYADYWTYPLVNKISIKEGFTIPGMEISGGFNLTITFYALCILGGALFVYALCNHKMKLEYGDKNIFESTFLIAFPAGIIGARIAYVIGNFNKEFGGQFSWDMFKIWNGGITILGGAIGGIAAGVLWFVFMKKKYSIWLAIDIVLPTILIAQAIGRFGNFFNLEVHGGEVSEAYFQWLPRIIFNNIHYSSATGAVTQASEGNVFLPLFFIEAVLNLFGYALLAHVFGIKLRKYTEIADVGFGYLIWYGLIRMILEPLRDSNYNMGSDGYWSWGWSIFYVALGCLLILGNHVVRYIIRKKKGQPQRINNKTYKKSLISAIAFAVVIVALVVVGILLVDKSTLTADLRYSPSLIGIMLISMGACVGIFLAIAIFDMITAQKYMKEKANNEQV